MVNTELELREKARKRWLKYIKLGKKNIFGASKLTGVNKKDLKAAYGLVKKLDEEISYLKAGKPIPGMEGKAFPVPYKKREKERDLTDTSGKVWKSIASSVMRGLKGGEGTYRRPKASPNMRTMMGTWDDEGRLVDKISGKVLGVDKSMRREEYEKPGVLGTLAKTLGDYLTLGPLRRRLKPRKANAYIFILIGLILIYLLRNVELTGYSVLESVTGSGFASYFLVFILVITLLGYYYLEKK